MRRDGSSGLLFEFVGLLCGVLSNGDEDVSEENDVGHDRSGDSSTGGVVHCGVQDVSSCDEA